MSDDLAYHLLEKSMGEEDYEIRQNLRAMALQLANPAITEELSGLTDEQLRDYAEAMRSDMIHMAPELGVNDMEDQMKFLSSPEHADKVNELLEQLQSEGLLSSVTAKFYKLIFYGKPD